MIATCTRRDFLGGSAAAFVTLQARAVRFQPAATRGRYDETVAIAESKKPVSITHAGCTAVADSPRNKTDPELRMLADPRVELTATPTLITSAAA